jgi:hypothetical protein
MTAGYEVQIRGRLSAALQASLEPLRPRTEVVTVLRPVDAAALHGLLERVRALGLELVDVHQLRCDEPRR